MEQIRGTAGKIRFRNEENCYTILSFFTDPDQPPITVTGTFFKIEEKEYFTLYGEYVNHPKYGMQFEVNHYESGFPMEASMLEEYLGSGIIKGIGKARAKNIIARFGADAVTVMEKTPERLSEIPGIGKRLAQLIGRRIKERTAIQENMLKLGKYGIGPSLGAKVWKKYGEDTFHILQTDPYQISQDIEGVSFLTADKIAKSNGMPLESPYRIRSGILFIMGQLRIQGSTCCPDSMLLRRASKLLGIEDALITKTVETMIGSGILVPCSMHDIRYLYEKSMYEKESACAQMLKKLNRVLPDPKAKEMIQKLGGKLDETQRSAALTAACSGIMVLTGGPGVGKTTTTNLIIEYFMKTGHEVLLAAPTGKAAKRMTEATGHPSSTIHRLLGIDPESHGFEHNEDNPLEADVIVIDEASMLDMPLAYSLVLAIPEDARLILVGDKNQLPSVGPGNVLSDLIASGVCPVVELTKIYRQAEGSDIIRNAHSILHGGGITLSKKDFYFKDCQTLDELQGSVLHFVSDTLPGFSGEKEIQVLTPLKVRDAGSIHLNRLLQDRLNPGGEEVKGLRVGDRVIHTRNNYNLEKKLPGGKKESGVFNGDTGVVTCIDREQGYLTVTFDDGCLVKYDFDQLGELDLAYALTVHKSQGSEYPVVVLPLWDYIPDITTMNLLYTGITRAKKFLVVVGPAKRFEQIERNFRKGARHTGLAYFLRQAG